MILVYFSSGGCVDDVLNNQTYHQFTSIIVITNLKGVMKNQDTKSSFFKIETIFTFRCFS